MFYGRHYSFSEVSAFLKIPLTTVKKRLYSARQKLRVQLQVALRDAGERASRARDGAEDAEIVLARWWSGVSRWVIARQDAWQTRSRFG
jgi:RNA polymerase sigma-70 factor (ECF subfamily)